MHKSICLFNHKGGVSKTTTTFNLGWALAKKNKKILIVDLDPQCNLTGLVIGYSALEDSYLDIFYNSRDNVTLKQIVSYIIDGKPSSDFLERESGSIISTKNENLFLLPGHLTTSDLDSQITISLKIASWIPATKNIPGDLPKILQLIAEKNNIDYLLYDLSPNIGGLNQVLLMSSNYFIIPTSPDYFCYQAISSLGKTIKKWKTEIDQFIFQNDINKDTYSIKNLPKFIGTIQQRYSPRNSMPGKSFQKWVDDIHESINKKFVPELDKINCVIEKK